MKIQVERETQQQQGLPSIICSPRAQIACVNKQKDPQSHTPTSWRTYCAHTHYHAQPSKCACHEH
eukprot:1150838-Pelagomonas_calceolata.AAC.4